MKVLAALLIGALVLAPAPSFAGFFTIFHTGSNVAATNNPGPSVTQTQSGKHNVSVVVQGSSTNHATTTQSGTGNVAVIIQSGTSNSATITQH